MTKGELLELISDLEDSDKLVFKYECDVADVYETELEFRHTTLVCQNRNSETEIHLEK